MIYGEPGYSLGFGREVLSDRCGELPVKPLSIEGRWRFCTRPALHAANASRNRALMYIQTATSRMQHVHDYTSLTCDPGRADRVNLPRGLSPHDEATVRCAKARPASNSSSGSQAPVRSKPSGPHASPQHTATEL